MISKRRIAEYLRVSPSTSVSRQKQGLWHLNHRVKLLPLENILYLLKMSGFDEGEIFYSDLFGSDDQLDRGQLTRTAAQKQFKKFIREFHEGTFVYPYRYVQ